MDSKTKVTQNDIFFKNAFSNIQSISRDLESYTVDTIIKNVVLDTKIVDVLGDGLGTVQLVDMTGSDDSVVRAARVSFAGDLGEPDPKRDSQLIRYLLKHEHGSPFEHNLITFRISAPLFISTQFLRHRIGTSFNFESRRYTPVPGENLYAPQKPRMQHKNNRQASVEATQELLDEHFGVMEYDTYQTIAGEQVPLKVKQSYMPLDVWEKKVSSIYYANWKQCYENYEMLLTMGNTKEQARAVLPVGQYSSFYMTVNLRSLFHFVSLRTHEGAQWEAQQYARAMLNMVEPHFPVSVTHWRQLKATWV